MDPNILEQLKQYYSAWRATNAIYEEWAKKYGLSYYELLVLLSLWEGKEPCTQKQSSGLCRNRRFIPYSGISGNGAGYRSMYWKTTGGIRGSVSRRPVLFLPERSWRRFRRWNAGYGSVWGRKRGMPCWKALRSM